MTTIKVNTSPLIHARCGFAWNLHTHVKEAYATTVVCPTDDPKPSLADRLKYCSICLLERCICYPASEHKAPESTFNVIFPTPIEGQTHWAVSAGSEPILIPVDQPVSQEAVDANVWFASLTRRPFPGEGKGAYLNCDKCNDGRYEFSHPVPAFAVSVGNDWKLRHYRGLCVTEDGEPECEHCAKAGRVYDALQHPDGWCLQDTQFEMPQPASQEPDTPGDMEFTGRLILEKVLADNKCEDFFEHMWDGQGVTISALTGNLVWHKFPADILDTSGQEPDADNFQPCDECYRPSKCQNAGQCNLTGDILTIVEPDAAGANESELTKLGKRLHKENALEWAAHQPDIEIKAGEKGFKLPFQFTDLSDAAKYAIGNPQDIATYAEIYEGLPQDKKDYYARAAAAIAAEGDRQAALTLLVIDYGKKCVVSVESGDQMNTVYSLKGGSFRCTKGNIVIHDSSFTDVKFALDAMAGTKPIPRIELEDDGDYRVFVEQQDVESEPICKETFFALSKLAGNELPIYSPARWMRVDCDHGGISVWRFTI